MKNAETLAGTVQTVLGPVRREDLGVILPHEHLLSDFTCVFKEPAEVSKKRLAHQSVNMENRGWVNYNWTQNLDNVHLWDEGLAVKELAHFTAAGGRTIADPTNIGIGRDPEALARLARLSGVNIIMGSGHYLHVAHPPDVRGRSEDSIAEQISRDLTIGVGDSHVRAGFIGEIGCTYPLADEERKCTEGDGSSAHGASRTRSPIAVGYSSNGWG
jgi:phosphotriesterase-related protein